MTKTSASPIQNSPVNSVYNTVSQMPATNAAFQALSAAGGTVYAVGGAVRDAFMGKDPNDVDLMVQNLSPEQVEATLSTLPGKLDFTGKSFGVFRYRSVNGDEVEVAIPRTDHSTGTDHKDFDVRVDPHMPVEQDLGRRDFTANAMALNLETGELHDPYNGQKDIEDKTLRVISPTSFEDDPLRTVRALVAHAKHGLKPDEETKFQMGKHAHSVRHIPQDRIHKELDKILGSPNPRKAIELAHDTGVLPYVLPEVSGTMSYNQNNAHHSYDLGTHILNVLEHTSKINKDPDVRMAALMHDVGKPDSEWKSEDGVSHYYYHPDRPGSADHARLGADQTREAMKRLRFPSNRIDRVHKLVKQHMFPEFTSAKGARKFLQKAGDEQTAKDLLDLREADRHGKKEDASGGVKVDLMRNLVDEVVRQKQPIHIRDLAVNGDDIKGMGFQGPEIGRVLRELQVIILDDPTLNTREFLLHKAVPYLAQ